MLTDFVIKGNRILALLSIIVKAHIELATNTIGDQLFAGALLDITNQSLGISAFSLSLHSFIKDDNEKEFKQALDIATRIIEKYKSIQDPELIPINIKLFIKEIEALIIDIKETVIIS